MNGMKWLNGCGIIVKTYSGIAVLPHDNHSYIQAPFESCTKEEYDAAVVNLKM